VVFLVVTVVAAKRDMRRLIGRLDEDCKGNDIGGRRPTQLALGIN
jgi:hypothetical protein